MSLEQVIAENTSALKELVALMKTNGTPVAKPATVEPPPAPAVPPQESPSPAEQPTGLDKTEVMKLVNAAVDAIGLTKVKDIIASFGADRVSNIPQDQWPAFAKVLKECI